MQFADDTGAEQPEPEPAARGNSVPTHTAVFLVLAVVVQSHAAMLRLGLARASRPAARLPALACAARHFSAATGATSGTFAKTLFREPDPSKPKLVLAYSGGLDTSTQLAFLAKERGFEQ